MKFDLMLHNNATKANYLFPNNEDLGTGGSHTFIFPEGTFSGLPTGEYTYFVIRNEREDAVVYEGSEVPLNTLIKTDEGNVYLRDLAYETGLLKMKGEDTGTQPVYRDRQVAYQYYKKKN